MPTFPVKQVWSIAKSRRLTMPLSSRSANIAHTQTFGQFSLALRAQTSSHSMRQQKPSPRTLQTRSQQASRLQPGVGSCRVQHSPAIGQTIGGAHTSQICVASVAHVIDHTELQHAAFAVQTRSQHDALLQPGEACAWQQSPVAGQALALHRLPHNTSARPTQSASQPAKQQNGSAEQTSSQQLKSSHPPVPPWMAQQSPDPGHPPSAVGVLLATVNTTNENRHACTMFDLRIMSAPPCGCSGR